MATFKDFIRGLLVFVVIAMIIDLIRPWEAINSPRESEEETVDGCP